MTFVATFPKAFDSTLPVMRLARADNDAGTNLALTLPDGRRASVFSEVRLMNSPKLGKQLKLMDGLLASSSATLIERNEAGYHGAALGVEKQTFVAKIVPVFRETARQTRTARAEHAARLTRTLDWNRAAEPNPVLRGDLRRWLLGHPVSERIGLLMQADYAVVVSALEIGQVVTGLDNAQWEAFLNHARAVIYIHKAGTAADFTLKPSVENITASGIDHVAAYKNAHNMLDQMREDGDLLETAEYYLQATAKFIALLGDVKIESIIGIDE